MAIAYLPISTAPQDGSKFLAAQFFYSPHTGAIIARDIRMIWWNAVAADWDWLGRARSPESTMGKFLFWFDLGSIPL